MLAHALPHLSRAGGKWLLVFFLAAAGEEERCAALERVEAHCNAARALLDRVHQLQVRRKRGGGMGLIAGAGLAGGLQGEEGGPQSTNFF